MTALKALRTIPVEINLAGDPMRPIRINQGDYMGRILHVTVTDDHVPVADDGVTARLTFNTNDPTSLSTLSLADGTAAGDWVPMTRIQGAQTATFEAAIPQGALLKAGEITMGIDLLDPDGTIIASRPFKAIVDPSNINFNLKIADGRGYLEALYQSMLEAAQSSKDWAEVAKDAAQNFGISVGTVTTVDYDQTARVEMDSNGGTKVLNYWIPRGKPGPQGIQGPQGVQGIQGPRGLTGAGLRIRGSATSQDQLPTEGMEEGDGYLIGRDLWLWTNGAWANRGEFMGPAGTNVMLASVAIEPNSQVSKSSLPAALADDAKVGDGIIGKDGRGYHVETVADDYVTVGPMISNINVGTPGPQGEQGPQGVQGIQGPRGATGPMPFDTVSSEIVDADQIGAELVKNGDQTDLHLKLPVKGVKGDPGAAGPKGDPGESITGPQGPIGPAGPQGPAGQDGADGKDGIQESEVRSMLSDYATQSYVDSKFNSINTNLPYRSGNLTGSSLTNNQSLGSLTAPSAGLYLILWEARIGSLNGAGTTSASIICSAGGSSQNAQCAVAVGGNAMYDGSAQTCCGFMTASMSRGGSATFRWQTTKSGGSITNGRCLLFRISN